MNDRIFVSVAAYRDPELIPTLRDCIAKARFPERLTFGICWQHEAGDAPLPDLSPSKVRLIDVPWQKSRGACWARAKIMRLWDGQEYFFQIDSHHRFRENWDALLIEQFRGCQAERPLLSTYPIGYDPALPLSAGLPTMLVFDHFTAEGNVIYRYRIMKDAARRSVPMRARFLGAGMLFTLGRFVEDVPYDPDLYFLGEELTLAIRAFTSGYSLFHPSVHVLWHQESPHMRRRHWQDHSTGAKFDAASLQKVGRFLAAPPIGKYGCGTARSFAEYEAYAGLNFQRRAASVVTRRGDEPPVPAPITVGPAIVRKWQPRIALHRTALPADALDRSPFWYVGFYDVNGVEIERQDVTWPELRQLLANGGNEIVIERRFESKHVPVSWMVWPTDRRRRWLERYSGTVERANAS